MQWTDINTFNATMITLMLLWANTTFVSNLEPWLEGSNHQIFSKKIWAGCCKEEITYYLVRASGRQPISGPFSVWFDEFLFSFRQQLINQVLWEKSRCTFSVVAGSSNHLIVPERNDWMAYQAVCLPNLLQVGMLPGHSWHVTWVFHKASQTYY